MCLENEKNAMYGVSKQGAPLNHSKSVAGSHLEEGE